MKCDFFVFKTGVLLMYAFLVTGCSADPESGESVQVSGQVTLDSEPVSDGTIWFASDRSGAEFNAQLEDDGTYDLTLLDVFPEESFKIYIGGISPAAGEEDEDGNPLADSPPPVPAKYQESATSGLTAQIKEEGNRTFDFELKSE